MTKAKQPDNEAALSLGKVLVRVAIAVLIAGALLTYLIHRLEQEEGSPPAVFKQDIIGYEGVAIGSSKQVAAYDLGFPSAVSVMYEDAVDVGRPDVNPYNYDEWFYEGGTILSFNSGTNKLVSVTCADPSRFCSPIFGVGINSGETEIRKRLGEPTEEELYSGRRENGYMFHPYKILSYKSLGLELMLVEGKVITIKKVTPLDPPNYYQWLVGWF